MDLLPKYALRARRVRDVLLLRARQAGRGRLLGAFPIAVSRRPARGPGPAWALAVGDVAGHGMPAALFLARLSAEVRLVLQGDVDPARCLTRLNEQIMADDARTELLRDLLAGDARRPDASLRGRQRGHLAPLIRRARGGPLERIGKEQTGLPLAVQDRCRYVSASATIEPGDVVVLLTDGIFEAMDADRKCLGIPELERSSWTPRRGLRRSAGRSSRPSGDTPAARRRPTT